MGTLTLLNARSVYNNLAPILKYMKLKSAYIAATLCGFLPDKEVSKKYVLNSLKWISDTID